MITGYQRQIVNELNDGITAIDGVTGVYNGFVEYDKLKNHKNEVNVFIISRNEQFNDAYEDGIMTTDFEFIIAVRWSGDINIQTSEDFLNKQIEIDEKIKAFLISFQENKIQGCQRCRLVSKEIYQFHQDRTLEIFYTMNFNLILI